MSSAESGSATGRHGVPLVLVDVIRPTGAARIPQDHRLHVVLEGISRGFTTVNTRKFVLRAVGSKVLVHHAFTMTGVV